MSHLRFILGLVFLVVSVGPAAVMARATALPEAKLRLLDGGQSADGRWLAGVELQLSGAAKTYWRLPGDSGLAPLFDWTGSTNIRHIDIAWPRPTRFPDASGSIFGYRERVIFPVTVELQDPHAPAELVLKLDFGVCEDLCVPVVAHGTVALAGGAVRAEIEAFRALVPTVEQFGDAQSLLRSIMPDPDHPAALLVTLTRAVEDLILEGPAGWYFADIEAVSVAEGRAVYRVHAVQKPAEASFAALPLVVTILATDYAREVHLALDRDGAIR